MARIPAPVNRSVWRTTKKYITALQNSGLKIQAAYLYGSQANGAAGEWSDIDIAIVASNLSGDWHDDLVHLNLLANQVDSRIEAVGYLPTHFRDESPLVWEIKTTGIPLLTGNGIRAGSTRSAAQKPFRQLRRTASTRRARLTHS